MMLAFSAHPERIEKIAGGWAAFGDGWAVHAPTKELALIEYQERVKFYKELAERHLETQDQADAKEERR
jgi:hypothetical protein